jgi:hypothetical protein
MADRHAWLKYNKNAMDWGDEKKVEAFNNKRARAWIKLYAKMTDARDSDDTAGEQKAREAMIKHEKQDQVYREKAAQNGCDWT